LQKSIIAKHFSQKIARKMLFFVEIPVFLNYFQKRCNKTSFFGFYITEDSKFDFVNIT